VSTTVPALAATVDSNEIAAVHDWVAAMPPEVAARYGAQARWFGDALALAVPVTGTLFFNRVIGLGNVQEATGDLVRDLVRFYRDLGTRFMIHVSLDSRSSQLPGWLTEHRLAPQGEWLCLYRRDDAVAVPSGPLRLESVGSECAASFARTLCRGYGMPAEWAPLYEGIVGRDRWRHLLAFDGDQPVATSSLFLNGDSAWCGNSSTLRAYRRHGLHTALSRLRLRHGIEAGCRLFTGETWRPDMGRINQSLRNHQRDDWREVYTRVNYVSDTAA
jgi:hypothetical protein